MPWSAQPEVGVVERMAALLLRTGTPYLDTTIVDRPLHFEDFTPYLPAMSVFGVPRALADTPLTDARLVFLTAAAVLTVLAVRLLGRPVPVRAAQLVAVVPATTLTVATGGDDLPVLALLVLCVVACHRADTDRADTDRADTGRALAGDRSATARRLLVAALAGGAALAMKLTAAPVLIVLAVFVWKRVSAWAAAVFGGTAVVTAAALVLPSILLDAHAAIEHVIRFPAGLTGVRSPAASPLPGYLLAQTGDAGRVAVIAALGLAAITVLVWVLARPPRDAGDAALRAAAGLVVAMLLMPATRYGYLVYPLVLLGAAIALSTTQRVERAPDQ